jgi:cell division septation protein DedD
MEDYVHQIRSTTARAALLALGLAAFIMTLAGVALGATGGTYTALFTGAPVAPAPAGSALADFDVQVHSRDISTWYQLESMDAMHGPDCSAPPAAHHLAGSYTDAVFQCRDHVMTAIRAGGYGVIYLTPNQLLDFSGGTGTVRWDQSTLRMSIRDFTSVWITPYEDNLALPFDSGEVDLQGVPRSGIHIKMDQFSGKTIFRGEWFSNFQGYEIPSSWWSTLDDALAAVGRTPSATERQTFELQVSATHVKFGVPALNYWPIDASIPNVGFQQGVVQFGHHSYNPTKDNAGVPATWHWDNMSVSPALPFTIIKADRRYVDNSSQTVTFNAPAPANAHIRFASIGRTEVSFDNGPFQLASKAQSSFLLANYHPEHQGSYWMPIPAGTRTVKLRWSADSWYTGPYIAKDFSIWSEAGTQSAGSQAPATATPTRTPPVGTTTSLPTSTPTKPPATATATATKPVSTATPTAPTAPTTAATYQAAVKTNKPVFGRRESVKLTATVKASAASTVLVDLEVYGPDGKRVYQRSYEGQAMAAGVTKTWTVSQVLPANAPKGTYTVKLGVFTTGWSRLLLWQDRATTFTVR